MYEEMFLGEKMFPRNVNYFIKLELFWSVIRLLKIYFNIYIYIFI